MTGYGAAEPSADGGRWWVEVRSTNHRFLEVVVRLPRELGALEDRVRAAVAERVRRGRVEVLVREDSGLRPREAVVDTELARRYADALERLRRELGLAEPVTLGALLALPEVVRLEEARPDPEATWEALHPVLQRALERLVDMRTKEGGRLAADLRERLARLESWVERVAQRAEELPRAYAQRLRQRVAELLRSLEVDQPPDEARLALEVAAFADRCDVREELVRLRSHLEEARALLEGPDGSVGRKLEFLLQEMQREVNTVGSKAADLEVTRAVVEMKSELEAIREQVQNVE
ncbi:MAG: YicC/YloC family endoribonuclease [Armatimonadota bacterium]|nr:YicC/YloC family endoribonuclease [Armatimonadota bacterium]MDR5675482.1 YicC/YloC family endoribonuclease [Armatimonadota bacterium]MDR7389195.1 YicC/YloC family endoribonuclease [Armatimonadota bacterium]MDR7391988.1 YicC/YloC family endoribonuclease [Armatimonadota bacterium]MDR7393424.1 YicC/YloC family endoribonuclease [Armatimonadota bacterium]